MVFSGGKFGPAEPFWTAGKGKGAGGSLVLRAGLQPLHTAGIEDTHKKILLIRFCLLGLSNEMPKIGPLFAHQNLSITIVSSRRILTENL